MTRAKIAILGGGAGAMTAAFYLTGAPGWRDRYEVTVYQLGWRLGGKGASGRNRERADRIEEHGLHLFLVFYYNAFAVIQALYAELGRAPDAPLARWDQAWQPHSYFVLQEDRGDRVEPWQFEFPPGDGTPGHGDDLPAPWRIEESDPRLMMTPPPALRIEGIAALRPRNEPSSIELMTMMNCSSV